VGNNEGPHRVVGSVYQSLSIMPLSCQLQKQATTSRL
jgi:hypothetical protein